MSADLPIWPTTKAILLYCWQERALALRYGLVPVGLLIVMDSAGTAAGIDIVEDKVWVAVSAIVALLAFMPLMVTWYYAVVFGHDEARRRPIFTFGQREGAVLGNNVLVALVTGIALLPLGGIVALGSGAVGYFNEPAGQVVAVVLGIPAVFVWFMVFTRLSVVIAYSAAGQHLGLRDAWRVTKPFGVSITWTHLILCLIGMGVATAAVAIVDFGLEAAGLGGENGRAPAIDLAVSATDAVFGIVYLVLATTLFGVVYRHLAAQSPPPEIGE